MMSSAAETQTVPSTSVDDLDVERFDAYLREHAPRLATDEVTREDALLRLRLAGSMGSRITPTLAGLYLFGEAPHLTVPQLSVVCARFDGPHVSDDVVARADVEGPLAEQLRSALDFVSAHARELVNQVDPASSALEFPLSAVREAIVNALVHRDLRSPGRVTVRLFPERLEVWSPGSPSALPEPIESYLSRGGVSLPRNPLVALIARQLGLAEQLGRGLPKMRRVVAEETHGELEISGEKDGTLVVIPSTVELAAQRSSELRAN